MPSARLAAVKYRFRSQRREQNSREQTCIAAHLMHSLMRFLAHHWKYSRRNYPAGYSRVWSVLAFRFWGDSRASTARCQDISMITSHSHGAELSPVAGPRLPLHVQDKMCSLWYAARAVGYNAVILPAVVLCRYGRRCITAVQCTADGRKLFPPSMLLYHWQLFCVRRSYWHNSRVSRHNGNALSGVVSGGSTVGEMTGADSLTSVRLILFVIRNCQKHLPMPCHCIVVWQT